MRASANNATNTSTSDTGEQQLITVDLASPVQHFVSQRVRGQTSQTTNQRAWHDTVAIRVDVVGAVAVPVVTLSIAVVRGISR